MVSDVEARARDAVAMLENPLFAEALKHLEREGMDAMIAAGVAQDRERLVAAIMVKQVRRLRAYFETIRDEGRFAASRVAREPMP